MCASPARQGLSPSSAAGSEGPHELIALGLPRWPAREPPWSRAPTRGFAEDPISTARASRYRSRYGASRASTFLAEERAKGCGIAQNYSHGVRSPACANLTAIGPGTTRPPAPVDPLAQSVEHLPFDLNQPIRRHVREDVEAQAPPRVTSRGGALRWWPQMDSNGPVWPSSVTHRVTREKAPSSLPTRQVHGARGAVSPGVALAETGPGLKIGRGDLQTGTLCAAQE